MLFWVFQAVLKEITRYSHSKCQSQYCQETEDNGYRAANQRDVLQSLFVCFVEIILTKRDRDKEPFVPVGQY